MQHFLLWSVLPFVAGAVAGYAFRGKIASELRLIGAEAAVVVASLGAALLKDEAAMRADIAKLLAYLRSKV